MMTVTVPKVLVYARAAQGGGLFASHTKYPLKVEMIQQYTIADAKCNMNVLA